MKPFKKLKNSILQKKIKKKNNKMDIFFLIFIILVTIALLISNIYILAYYCHPDDNTFGSALICKLAVIIGMTLAWAQVLILPLDVANNRSFGGGINMQIFWEIVYISTAIMIIFIIPALSAYYESDPDDSFVRIYLLILFFLFPHFIFYLILV